MINNSTTTTVGLFYQIHGLHKVHYLVCISKHKHNDQYGKRTLDYLLVTKMAAS